MTDVAARPRPTPRLVLPGATQLDEVARLAAALGLPAVFCGLLYGRGHRQPESARAFLRPALSQLHDPLLMRGMPEAVERVTTAIARGETMVVHGDYDVDGICATTILVRTIRHLGGKALPFIPHRLRDGYDLTDAGVRAAADAGARLLITCDCGTTAHAAVDALARLGVDTIVSDHHLPAGPPPSCTAVLNPRLPGCGYPDKDLCAAGIAFKLALALLQRHGASANVALNMMDLVALATVADVAPLRGENRVLVRKGLRLMADSRSVGLRALVAAAGLEGRLLTAGRIGFVLAPRLNAAGRIGHAMRGVQLLLSEDAGEANAIARELEELNRERQAIDRATLDAARRMVELRDLDSTFGLVVAAEGWHPGVVGIVASRLVEEFCRPAVLVALEDGIGKGSGRSIPAFDLHAGLSECRELFLRFGGHRAAAGITIEAGRVGDFTERFNAIAASRLTKEQLQPELRIDLEIPLHAASEDLERLIRHFEPCGVGNPAPVLMSRGVRILESPRSVGENGIRFRFGEAQRSGLDGLWWGAAERLPEFAAQDVVDVVYRLERDTYFEAPRLVARLADVRR